MQKLASLAMHRAPEIFKKRYGRSQSLQEIHPEIRPLSEAGPDNPMSQYIVLPLEIIENLTLETLSQMIDDALACNKGNIKLNLSNGHAIYFDNPADDTMPEDELETRMHDVLRWGGAAMFTFAVRDAQLFKLANSIDVYERLKPEEKPALDELRDRIATMRKDLAIGMHLFDRENRLIEKVVKESDRGRPYVWRVVSPIAS